MRKISPLEQEYRQLKRREAPELWSRIEGNLKEHPERGAGREQEEREKRGKAGRPYRSHGVISGGIVFAAAASAAAVFLLVITIPWYSRLLPAERKGGAGGLTQDFSAGITAAETTASAEKHEVTADGPGAGEAGVLYGSQLNLAEYQSLSLPAGAVTVAEDTMYFSEQLLGDTELLCLGTVADVCLETDSSGYPASLVYEIRVDSVCYSAGYATGLTELQVKSPIVSAVGGESQILYQLQAGSSYALPLKATEGGWELIFPFAPQIQAVSGGFLFHSGFASLTNSETFVVVGRQEGVNDFYYDRMLFRDDDHFLSELISLVTDQT